jgi:hypothetical protein
MHCWNKNTQLSICILMFIRIEQLKLFFMILKKEISIDISLLGRSKYKLFIFSQYEL